VTTSVTVSAPGLRLGCATIASIASAARQMNSPYSANCTSYRDEHLAARSGAR
jgi:hypothetical protein